MPPAPPDFSFDRDIAPHASRFFDRVDANPNLTHAAKMRLHTSTLGGVEGIESQRLKLQAERDEGRARKLQYENQSLALEKARAERARREQMEVRRGGVMATAKGILDSNDDPETKRQKLARTALDFAGDDDALHTFGIAEKALPKESAGKGFTPSQIASMTERLGDEVSPEELPIVLSSPALLGNVLRRIAKKEEAAKEAKKLKDDLTEKGVTQKLELAKMPLKFDKDENDEESDWLEDSSTAVATKVVEALGNPEEQKRFLKLKTAGSDRERAMMIELIQLRHRFDNERVPDGPSAAERARAKTGL